MDRVTNVMLAQIISKIKEIDLRLTDVEKQLEIPTYIQNKNGDIEKVENRNKNKRTARVR